MLTFLSEKILLSNRGIRFSWWTLIKKDSVAIDVFLGVNCQRNLYSGRYPTRIYFSFLLQEDKMVRILDKVPCTTVYLIKWIVGCSHILTKILATALPISGRESEHSTVKIE